MDEGFDYSKLWGEQEKIEDKKAEKEIEKFPKGSPRKGIKGKYIKPKGYLSVRQVKKDMKKYRYNELNSD
jgi:hypothetical protein